ncbi:MAG: ABC transporter ATP-binding protein [Dehalococcoidia bacterium]|nr:ABC transporter ATP-binding protein [Dehalococcoidia bacterium]
MVNKETVFQATDVGYRYGDSIPALNGVTLSIQSGEKVAILGANGSGKSTFLKLLDGLYFATSGELLAFGQPLTEKWLRAEESVFAFRRRVGFVFQDSDVQLFSATVWDEVAFGPLQLGLTGTDLADRVDAALGFMQIGHLKDRPPYRLSGGEKKKVALASVLVLNPRVLLLDEPTANLDPRTQSSLVELLNELSQDGCTIVTATHDLDIVEVIADRVYVIGEDHRLVAQGEPEEVLSRRDLLLACNLIHEHAHKHKGDAHVHPHPHLSYHDHEH